MFIDSLYEMPIYQSKNITFRNFSDFANDPERKHQFTYI